MKVDNRSAANHIDRMPAELRRSSAPVGGRVPSRSENIHRAAKRVGINENIDVPVGALPVAGIEKRSSGRTLDEQRLYARFAKKVQNLARGSRVRQH
jgi:hypothetical protein